MEQQQQQTMSDPQATRRFRFKVILICFFSFLALALVIAVIVHLCRRRPWNRKWYKYHKHYWWKRSTDSIHKIDQIVDLRGISRQAELVYGKQDHHRRWLEQDLSDPNSIWKRAKVIQLQ